jgi:cytochrome oxidase Cu insertion factor (SCO1/SenC/PrrC family)
VRRLPALLLGLSLALALCAAVLAWRMTSTDYDARGLGQAAIGGPFRLTDQDGHTRIERDFRGKWTLVYFGYTYCPDVCPTTLQDMAIALRRLGPKARQIVPLFITLDPDRDHPAVLRKYLAAFGPEFVGLTGTPQEIASVAHAYRVYFAKHPLPGVGYSIDHASTIYLMDRNGHFVSILDDQEGAAALEKDLASRL